MSTGSTFDHTITRDELIALAFKECHALEHGAVVDAMMQADGVMALGLLVRELSDQDVYIHAQQTDSLALVANQSVYTSTHSLPTDLGTLLRVMYRDGQGLDRPVTILDRMQYEAASPKVSVGDPCAVFLTDELVLSSRTLYVIGVPSSIDTQSVVTGTDASVYRCIKKHTADMTNKPVTGANWRLYWELGGAGPTAWAVDTAYTAPQLLRLTSERPLYDFDAAGDNPDLPASHANYLKHMLTARLGGPYGLTAQEISWHEGMADKIYSKTFRKAMRKKTTSIHNKTSYF